MQDVKEAVAELERCMTRLGLKGVEINDHVNGRTLEEPEFRPFWKAAEQMGALVFFHQGGETLVSQRTTRYHLPNTIGNLADRAVTFATLVHGGVLDECPRPQDLPRPRRWLHVLWHRAYGPRLAGSRGGTRTLSRSRRARISGASTTTASCTPSRHCASSSTPWAPTACSSGLMAVRHGARLAGGVGARHAVLSQAEKEAILWKNLASLLGL